MTRLIIVLMCMGMFGAVVRSETFTVSGPAFVDDAALLDGEFANWNFGGGPLLEAGRMGGIYAEHYAVSVVRFDLRATQIEHVTSAKLRFYKPKDFIQRAEIPVALYEVTRQSANWQEGTGICEPPQPDAITRSTSPAPELIGGERPLVNATAPVDRAQWLEFALPPDLVRRWLAEPQFNGGLLVIVQDPAKEWGHHVYFHSSEHWDGKGPELVIEGTPSKPRRHAPIIPPPPSVYALPPEESLQPWLEKNGRLARFTKDGAMTAEQARLFQFYDTTVREKLIKERYQVPLVKVLREMDALVKKGGDNDAALREHLRRVRELLLVWEYIRETSWYTSGPLADVLTAKQLGILFGRSIFGRMEEAAKEKGEPIWQPVPPDKIDAHVQQALKSTRERLKMTPEQFAVMEQGIAEAERLENEYLAKFRHDFDACRRLLDAGDVDEDKMFRIVRDMHLHHELFLYYQSIFDTPRWSLFIQHAPPTALAEWIIDTRRGHYERQTGRKISEEDE
ncbi:MAG TPA: DNRLRE domain-containing protein [Tepidisphaeraceae bacterium]|nr:DNRLRE domain-containing protein [Tepidisphaeraceae bacterium]